MNKCYQFHKNILPIAILACLLYTTYLLYSPALTAGFMFDDSPNLEELGSVSDLESALRFIFGGEAGPLGRPIALASFLLNITAWPSEPSSFLQTNILIHLINGLLLFWFFFRLTTLILPSTPSIEWLSLSAASLWLLNPLLASTTLFVVQRMTSLSATFVLSGLVLYIIGRSHINTQPIIGAALASIGICFGTLLAILTKENGILLPFYALIVEAILIKRYLPKPPKWFQVWVSIFLILPIIIILAYVVIQWPNIIASYSYRPWTLSERLLTETRILWQYLFQIIFPNRAGLGPFQDDYLVSQNLIEPPTTLLALIGWLVSIYFAWKYRLYSPFFAFAIFWFIIGHSLESTIFSLELYFEHRNYLPAIGPLLAITYYIFRLLKYFKNKIYIHNLIFISLIFYVGLVILTLWQTTTLWGSSFMSAEIWHKEHPTSSRAAQFLSQEYTAKNDLLNARNIIESVSKLNPKDASLALQTLQLSCLLDDTRLYRFKIDQVLSLLKASNFSSLNSASLDALSKLTNMYIDKECKNIKSEEIHNLANELFNNPQFRASHTNIYQLHHIKARLYAYDKLLEPTLNHLEAAFAARPTLTTALLVANTFISAGLYRDAYNFLSSALKKSPTNPFLKKYWEDQIGYLQKGILKRLN